MQRERHMEQDRHEIGTWSMTDAHTDRERHRIKQTNTHAEKTQRTGTDTQHVERDTESDTKVQTPKTRRDAQIPRQTRTDTHMII